MSTWTVARTPRVAFVLTSVAILMAGTLGMAATASGASPASPGSILAPIGEITPTALGPGTPATSRPSFAQPFRTLDSGALRAAKLHAAALASRGSRGPSIPTGGPLAGLFNNLDSPGLSQLTVAPPDSTGSIGPNHYIEMVNQQIGVYDRNLNLISSTDNGTFTGAGASLSVTDPQIQWDGQSGHWLYAALGVATGANMLIFGWSKTSDPSDLTNGWCRFGVARGNLLDDYPKLGHDDNFISIGTERLRRQHELHVPHRQHLRDPETGCRRRELLGQHGPLRRRCRASSAQRRRLDGLHARPGQYRRSIAVRLHRRRTLTGRRHRAAPPRRSWSGTGPSSADRLRW